MFEGAAFNGLSIAVAVVSALLALAGVIYARRSTRPPARTLQIEQSVEPLAVIGASADRSEVEIRVKNTSVKEPFITILNWRNQGRFDISSSQFDPSTPFVVDLGVKILSSRSDPARSLRYQVNGNCIIVPPQIFKSGSDASISLVSDGRPTLQLQGSLVDVPARIVERADSGVRVYSGTRTMRLVTMVIAALMLLSIGASTLAYTQAQASAQRALAAQQRTVTAQQQALELCR